MPTITLTDNSSASVNADVLDTSVIGKTPESVIHFLRSDVMGVMGQTLDQVQINLISAGFSFEPSLTLLGGAVNFQAGSSLTGEIDLYKPAGSGQSSPLFTGDQFGTTVDMGDSFYLALAFQLGVRVGATGAAGAYCIQPQITSGASAKLYLAFAPVAGRYPTLKDALANLCGSFALPSSIEDVKRMATGSVFAFNASGTIKFNGSLDLLMAVNPTVTPGVSTSFGPISISAGPSVTVGGGFSLTGEFEIRVWKQSDSIFQLGYYKKRGSSFTVSLDTSVGFDVDVGGFAVIEKIYGLLGDSGKLDPAWLKSNVPNAVADQVQSAYQTAIQTKLSIAIDTECDTSLTNQAAFSWKFDLASIDAKGIDAFSAAIRGDLSPLLSADGLPAGISKAGSVLDRIEEREHVLTFNFLGLFDHASVQDSIVDISSKVSEDGQLILTDTAHLTRLSADATPFVKANQLQRVLAEDCVATIGYAAGCGALVPSLEVNYTYFDYKGSANISDLQSFISTAEQLEEAIGKDDWSRLLESTAASQHAYFLAELVYDAKTARALFLDQNSTSRTIDDYEQVGRNATLNAPGIGLSDAFVPWLEDDSKWKQIRNAGTMQNFSSILGVDQISPPQWATVSFAWTLHIIFWAAAMHSAGSALQNLAQYLAANAAAVSWQDQELTKRRQIFAGQLNTAIQKAPLFHDALGLLIMYNAARPAGKSVTIRYGSQSKMYS